MRLPPGLLALAVVVAAAAHRSAASRGEQPPAVPSPMQIQVISENFKTVLHWQYPSMPETPRFIVEIKPYNLGSYKVVSTCVNISTPFCDVTREIDDPFNSHWLRVKAVVGSRQSEYVETDEFILRKCGKVGPPKLNLSRHGDEIIVDIYHPEFPSVELLPWIQETYSQLMCIVTFWDKENENEDMFFGDNCDMYKCSLNISIPAEGSTYCVSAKESFYHDLMFGDPSEESCIHVPLEQPPEQPSSTQYIIISCAVILGMSVMLTLCYSWRKLKKENIRLPKSLVSVIRNLNTESILESKSEAKYISVISFVPFQSAVSVNNDEVTSLEVEPQEETVSCENSSEGASFLPHQEAPAKGEEMSVQESTEEVPSDDEQNREVKESYFISDSSQMDICSNSSGPEISDKEIQQTVIPSSSLKFSGYDKPHVPLDMLIDVGEEQPVIAYRSAD